MSIRVFIDGEAGTTGLQVRARTTAPPMRIMRESLRREHDAKIRFA